VKDGTPEPIPPELSVGTGFQNIQRYCNPDRQYPVDLALDVKSLGNASNVNELVNAA
jgi:hypothetical protein